jgi:hypothetical protein
MFGKSQKTLEGKSGEKGGFFISVIDFWGHKLADRERPVNCSIVTAETSIVGPKFGSFSTHDFT